MDFTLTSSKTTEKIVGLLCPKFLELNYNI